MGILSTVVIKRKIAKLKDAMVKNPSPATIGELARFHIQCGNNESAFYLIESKVQEYPDSEIIQGLWNYLSKNKVSGILRDMLQVLEENPRPDHFSAVIGIYREQHNISAATEYSRRFIKEFPEHSGAYRTMGEMRMERFAEDFAASDGKAAECALKQALELESDDIESSILLARLYYWCGVNSRALELLGKVVEKEPGHQEAKELRDAAMKHEGQDEDPDLCFSAIEENRGFFHAWPEDGGTKSQNLSEDTRDALKKCLHASVDVEGVVQATFVAANGERLETAHEKSCSNGDQGTFQAFIDNLGEAARKATLRMDIGAFEKGVVEGAQGGVLLRDLKNGQAVAFQLEGHQNTAKASQALVNIVEEMVAICGKSNETASEENE